MADQTKKQFIAVVIPPEVKEAVWQSYELERTKKIKADKLQIIFVLLELDKLTGTPKKILRLYNEVQTHIPALDEHGNRIPSMMLFPFRTQKDQPYFKCDNCNMTGQDRGYYMMNQYHMKLTFCMNCTEGH